MERNPDLKLNAIAGWRCGIFRETHAAIPTAAQAHFDLHTCNALLLLLLFRGLQPFQCLQRPPKATSAITPGASIGGAHWLQPFRETDVRVSSLSPLGGLTASLVTALALTHHAPLSTASVIGH
jgi:hypothetical protein